MPRKQMTFLAALHSHEFSIKSQLATLALAFIQI
jgi:hypothetical protein